MQEPKFTGLLAWRKAHAFALGIYQISGAFPKAEIFGLAAQIRRSSLSVPANIAEGTKKSRAEFRRCLKIAEGSLEETKHCPIVARDLAYIDQAWHACLMDKANEVGFLLHRLYSSLTKKNV